MTNAISLNVPADTLRAALIAASTEQVRYYLNGVYVDPKGYLVSTDGHRLFCAKLDLTDVPPFDGWIMSREALKRALTGYKAQTINICPNRIGDIACSPVDGNYPDWRRVVPNADLSGETAQFNASYIADLAKMGALMIGKKGKDSGMTYYLHHNGNGPAGVTFPGCEDAFAVLMPYRTKAEAGDWAARRTLID